MLTGLNRQMIVPQERYQITNRTIAQEIAETGWQPNTQQKNEDVLNILNRQYEDDLRQLDTSVKTLQSEMTRDSQYKLETLSREHEIKKQALEDKYGRHNIHVDPEVRKKYENELLNLNTQFTVGVERISGGVRPGLDTIETNRQQSLQQLEAEYEQKRQRVQTIRDLVAKGVIQNPAAALQEEYQIAGITVPLSSFESQLKTPRQQLNDVAAALRILKGQIPTKTQFIGGQLVEAGQAPEGVKEQIAELEEMQRQLVPQVYPQYVQSPTKVTPLSRAATKALTGDGEMGGTLAGRVQAAKNTATPSPYTTAVGMTRNKQSDPLGLR